MSGLRLRSFVSAISAAAFVVFAGVRCTLDAVGPASGSSGQASGTNSGAGSGSSSGAGGASLGTAGAGGSASGSRADASANLPVWDGAAPMRGPAAPTLTTRFPFPQNREKQNCTYPSHYDNAVVRAAFDQWKRDLVTSDNAGGHRRVQRTSTDGIDGCRPANSTVSEGIAYGMLVAVYMDDQSLFDDLWLYEQQNVDSQGLMNWAPNGSGPSCAKGATDADEDMAFALIMADKQWTQQGSLGQPYSKIALQQVQNVWKWEVFKDGPHGIGIQPGEWSPDYNHVNISYFAPSYYRVFAQIDPGDAWGDLVDLTYATLAGTLNQGNQSNGLVPGWGHAANASTSFPSNLKNTYASGASPADQGFPGVYQYDACRTPFRVGIDWCLNGEVRAQAYVAKTSSFFSSRGGVAKIVDGYALDGTPAPSNPNATLLSAAFIGPAAVGAMSASTYQGFLDEAYGQVASGGLVVGGKYYEESWTLISLIMMTGNFLNYASP